MTVNEVKLINPGEYMKTFLAKYQDMRYTNNMDILKSESYSHLLPKLLDIVNAIEKKRLYRGKGGEHMRNAICGFIENVSRVHLEISPAINKRFLDTIDDCLKSPLEHVQNAAKSCFDLFSKEYHTVEKKEYTTYFNSMLKKSTTDSNFAVKRGYTRALSGWSQFYLT